MWLKGSASSMLFFLGQTHTTTILNYCSKFIYIWTFLGYNQPLKGRHFTSSGLVLWPAESCQLWPHLQLQCSGTKPGSARFHSGAQQPHLQPEPHPCGFNRREMVLGLFKGTAHSSASTHRGLHLTYPTRSRALTFCSGPTRDAYFLASYLLCCFMQISTKGFTRQRRQKLGPFPLSQEQNPRGHTVHRYFIYSQCTQSPSNLCKIWHSPFL